MKSEVPEITRTAIGTSPLRKEDARLLTGRGQYTGDIALPGMCHVAMLRSPFAHARIRSVDTERAEALDGVHLVWTGSDSSQRSPGLVAEMELPEFRTTIQPLLAGEVVLHAGEAIAAVVADSRRIAEDAVDLIEVDYEPLPVVADPEEARRGGELANEIVPDNIIHKASNVVGKIPGDAMRVNRTFTSSRVYACPMEGRAYTAEYDWTTGQLTLWSSTQMPAFAQSMIALFMELPEQNVRVIAPDVGGGFGLKAALYPEELLTCALAIAANRPVQWLSDRREELISSEHAKQQVQNMTLCVNSDGKFVGIHDRVYSDSGAYNNFPWTVMAEAPVGLTTVTGVYDIPAVDTEYECVTTNKVRTGPYRGVGWGPANMAREALIDEAARRTELSPFEIRRRNVLRDDQLPYKCPSGVTLLEGSFLRSLDELEQAVDYQAFLERQRQRRAAGELVGLGISLFNECGGTGSRAIQDLGFPVSTHDTSTVRLEPTGKLLVTTSIVSQGQGHATTLAQVVADQFGLPISDVTVRAGDSDQAYGYGTWSSRGAVIGAGSILRAGDIITSRVKQAAAHMLEASPEDIVLSESRAQVRGAPEVGMSLADVAGAIYFAESTHPPDFEPSMEATAAYDPPALITSNGAHAVIVKVDGETGLVTLEQIYVVEDCGVMINPMIVDGQIMGGIAQAIGLALYEEVVYDEQAQPLTTSFMDYLLPVASQIPPVDIRHIETPSKFTPAGIKGLGESAMVSLPGAILNGVNDALAPLGVFIDQVPITPERVRAAIGSNGGGPAQ